MTMPEQQEPVGAIDAYLARVAEHLPGPRRVRAALLAELRAGLLDAVEANREAGLTPSTAARAATGEFGDPFQIAVAFRAELTTAWARRIAVVLLASAPLVALAWVGAAVGSHFGVDQVLPSQWSSVSPAWRLALPLTAVGLIVGIGAAAVSVAASGRLSRWLPDCTRFAPASAITAGIAVAVADVILLLLLTRRLASAPATLDATPVTIAALASTARLFFARQAVRRPRAA
jgi:hypothetical protein